MASLNSSSSPPQLFLIFPSSSTRTPPHLPLIFYEDFFSTSPHLPLNFTGGEVYKGAGEVEGKMSCERACNVMSYQICYFKLVE